jgi:hypothetical protein
MLRIDRSPWSLTMPTWTEPGEAEPAFAADVRTLLDAGRHRRIATLRAEATRRVVESWTPERRPRSVERD